MYFIIEEGQFNLGDYQSAINMIDLASMTGANAIEFQLAYAEDFYTIKSKGYQIYKKREFSDTQLAGLVDYSTEKGLDFVATCLSHKLVSKMAKFNISAYNLNASDINNFFILDAILETGLPFFVSTPLATMNEITEVVNRIDKRSSKAEYTLLHGQHTMASGSGSVSVCDTSLGVIEGFKKKFNKPVGFIDHTQYAWMPSVAVAAGACVVSKHLSPSRLFKGPDFDICLNPEEMQQSVNQSREVWKSIGMKSKELTVGEDLDRTVMRRSIVAGKAIAKGEVITCAHLSLKRPGTGLSPENLDAILGMKATKDIQFDEFIDKSMLC